MQSLMLSGVALLAVSAGAWMFNGGSLCGDRTCSSDEKTSLTSAELGESCPVTGAASEETCSADQTMLVSTHGNASCESSAVTAKGSCSAEKTSLVSVDGKAACSESVAAQGARSAEKTTLVSTDNKATCEAGTVAAKGTCAADKTTLVSADGKANCDAGTAAVKSSGDCCPAGDKADKASLVSLEPSESAKPAKPIDAIKSLAGKWKGETEHGTAELEFKVSSGGSTVVETMFPGTAHEMTNVYVMDGENLLVTHYCAGGNAPRMKLTRNENGTMVFEYHDATNLPSRNMMHMGQLEITMNGDDQIVEKWTNFKDGQPAGNVEFKLDRVK